MTDTKRKPAEVFHPSEYIREAMNERGWDAAELARRMGYDVRSVDLLLHGHAVSDKTARALAHAFGTSWELWMGLQMMWDGSLLHAIGREREAKQGEA